MPKTTIIGSGFFELCKIEQASLFWDRT